MPEGDRAFGCITRPIIAESVAVCQSLVLIGYLGLLCRKEGGTDGGIVVQDCFELLNTLLRRNPQNQLMFRWECPHLLTVPLRRKTDRCNIAMSVLLTHGCRREGGQLGAVLDMLKLPESLFSRGLPRQRAANLLCLLDTLTLNLTQQIDAPGGQVSSSRHFP